MKAEEVRAIMKRIGLSYAELAYELCVSERSVRRWAESGTGQTAAGAALHYASRLNSLGIAWRDKSVAIAIGPSGVEFLTDEQALERGVAP